MIHKQCEYCRKYGHSKEMVRMFGEYRYRGYEWFHPKCFTETYKIKTADELQNDMLVKICELRNNVEELQERLCKLNKAKK